MAEILESIDVDVPVQDQVVIDPVMPGDGPTRVRDLLPTLIHQVPVGVGVVRRDLSFAFANDALARLLDLPPRGGRRGARMAELTRYDDSAYERDADPVGLALTHGQGTGRLAVGIRRWDGVVDRTFITTIPVLDDTGKPVSVIVYLEGRPDTGEDPSMREAYVDTLSHELRTPITAIYGGTQLLRNDDLAPDVRATVLTDIAEEAERLHLLIEDLIALARVEHNVLNVGREPVLVQHVVEHAAATASRRWPDRELTIRAVKDVPAVSADDGLLAQVVRNLIGNAIATSPAGSQVDIVIDATISDVHVTIGDRGAGFPSGLGDDAFHLYHGSPTVAAHRPDTGLALFVAGALVEAHGGRIWQTDRPGGGAEVGFTLPIYMHPDAA